MARKSKRRWSWRHQVILWRSAVTLANWRWRTQWFLLLVTAIGMTLAVMLVSALPLFNDVMSTAGLRAVLRNQPSSTQVLATATLNAVSSPLSAAATSQIDGLIKQDAGQYLPGTPQTTLITGNWNTYNTVGNKIDFYGVPMQTTQEHLQILQGHLPPANQSSSTELDVALTSSAAAFLHASVGTTIPVQATIETGLQSRQFNSNGYSDTFVMHVVGIFQVLANDPYWNGYTLYQPPSIAGVPPPPVLALTDQASLYHLLDAVNMQHSGGGIYFSDRSQNLLFLSYDLNASQITSNDLSDLITRLGTLQEDISQQFAAIPGPNIAEVELSGQTVHNVLAEPGEGASILEKFQNQVQVTRTPVLFLTAEIFCLLLFFISMMAGALVEREQTSIAVLRSRGANRQQVFGSLLTQGLALCVLAGLVGPLLALLLVSLVTPHLLTASTGDALNVLMLDFSSVARSLGLYALLSIAVIFLTLLLTLYLAVRVNILTQWRETARSTRLPLWQRLRLDLVVMALAVTGYAAVLYLENTQQLLSAQGKSLVITPLELLAPLLLLLAGILGFMRLFPWLLNQLMRLAQRRRDLTSMLALAQMARSPRQSMRMTLLLGLATAFTLFALVFSASQSQRGQDLANYQSVSDFSGYNLGLPVTTPSKTVGVLKQVSTTYQQLAGVTSVSVGYLGLLSVTVDSGTAQSYLWPTDLSAVDADTFAQTASWTKEDSSQSLQSLMRLLVARRPQAMKEGVVPAIVAASTWQMLGLTPGTQFHLTDTEADTSSITYVAIAEVNHIPPFNDSIEGAVLTDYQTLTDGLASSNPNGSPLQPNYVWLNTGNASGTLNAVRQTLNSETSPLALTGLVDRRALRSGNAADPLTINLLTLLSMGVAASLLLAFLANLLLPLLSVRARLTSFAVLRALGTDPGQVTTILTWEVAIVLGTSLVLGMLFGALLAFTSVPPLVFTGLLPTSLVSISSSTVYALQQIIPVTVVLPAILLLALLVLFVLCLLALVLMTRLAQRPLLGQTLRLEED